MKESGLALKEYEHISELDVRAVTSMRMLFLQGYDLLLLRRHQPLGIEQLTDMMTGMFSRRTLFNQFVATWDVSKVTTMRFTFIGATAFTQPFNDWMTD